jgi:tagaturonate epimerase
MQLEKYSFGLGDRFGKEGLAQLQAVQEINRLGIPVVPVWNKSNREHLIIGSVPEDVEKEAAAAVAAGGYRGNYYVDADHISLDTVDRFTDSCNFFTIDVARYIGLKPDPASVSRFLSSCGRYTGILKIPGIETPFRVTRQLLLALAENYLAAMEEVKKIYDHICRAKAKGSFVTEVSVDEAGEPQHPVELFFILAMLKDYQVEVQTIAPRFSGLFAKGIDYLGDVNLFAGEFHNDMAMIRFAIRELGMPENLKLSVHSGSDKFSVYPAIRAAMQKFDAGIHVKTAGTTWLEEVIGLAVSGNEGLAIIREIYAQSLHRMHELTAPYAGVLHLDRQMLPAWDEVKDWEGRQFLEALTHDSRCKAYNPHMRQLMHVGYKIAAEMGNTFYSGLDKHAGALARRVTHNLLERHLKPLFLELK